MLAAPAPPAPTPARASARSVEPVEDLRLKPLGDVAVSGPRAASEEVKQLRAICRRVIEDPRTGRLGCAEIAGAGRHDNGIGTIWVSSARGHFTRAGADEAIVVATDPGAGWATRLFLLEQRSSRWWVVNVHEADSQPTRVQRLRAAGGRELFVATWITAGTPRPSAVRALRFSREKVEVAMLGPALTPFMPCMSAPASMLDNVQLRDADGDGRTDVVLAIHELVTPTPAEAQRLQQACGEGRDASLRERRASLIFPFDGSSFRATPATIKKLEALGESVAGPVPWEERSWQLGELPAR
ncbi:hypothetical protein [Sorangium sp. So ce385]|uniref:hypothetical protein n=1 Tax=Sorangium sp. So ce385 TaxID=3133308 RepID=UPI003F5B4119